MKPTYLLCLVEHVPEDVGPAGEDDVLAPDVGDLHAHKDELQN